MAGTKVEKRDQAERLLRYLELLSRGGGFAVLEMSRHFGIRAEACIEIFVTELADCRPNPRWPVTIPWI